LLLIIFSAAPCSGYSVLTHEAILDSVWESQIRPLLLKRFPHSTQEELQEAHAYLYGGSLTQDMGYAPLAARFFTDLTHYVRSGDFVASLIQSAEALNEFAFALGALAHYAADARGHPVINRITGLVYPKLVAKFGEEVTYCDSPASHLKTEFGLDVVQVSRGLYAPDAYHAFIGFQVAEPVLKRAFQATYGLEWKDVFRASDVAVGTYRFSVGKLIPEMTKVAWQSKKKDLEKLRPGITRSQFVYVLPRKKYESEWGNHYSRPGFLARILAVLLRVVPRFGPFKVLAFPVVPSKAEPMFLKSFESTVEYYRSLLKEVGSGRTSFPNHNLDTGKAAQAGDYKLADQTYMRLVDKLATHHFASLAPDLRENILQYFGTAHGAAAVSLKTQQQLSELRAKELTELSNRH
jgi:hypothetical protein